MLPIILGSTSPYRREILKKLRLTFHTASPNIDETPQAAESAHTLVKRLAEEKALAVAKQYPNALIIGSDQVAVLGEHILGKPKQHDEAVRQLTTCSGKTVRFLTGLALYNSQTQRMQSLVDPFDVSFKTLTPQEINAYLLADLPYQCAGSFRSEGLGIYLFDALHGSDPNSLVGLPLIQLISLLKNEGVSILSIETP